MAGLAATFLVGISGSTAALGDTLYPPTSFAHAIAQDSAPGSPLLLRLRVLHPVSALAAALFVIWLMVRSRQQAAGTPLPLDPREQKRFSRATTYIDLAVALLALQFALGIADILLLTPAWMQLLHLLGADLYWVALVLLSAEVIWQAEQPDVGEIATPPLPSLAESA